MPELSVGTFNVRGLRDPLKRATVFGYLRDLKLTVVLLQEVHLRDEREAGSFSMEWGLGGAVWSVGGVHSSGVGILLGGGAQVEQQFVITQGRVVGVDFVFGGASFRAIVFYGSQSGAERRGMVEDLVPHCATNRHMIIGGDLNEEVGRGGSFGRGWEGLVQAMNLIDGGCVVQPPLLGPTWRNSRGASSRLDYVFFSRTIALDSGKAFPTFFSDHDGLVFRGTVTGPLFGSGYWKLNCSVLGEELFRASCASFLRGQISLRSLSGGAMEWWEVVKGRIKTFCIRYSVCRARKRRAVTRYWQTQLGREQAIANMGGVTDEGRCQRLTTQLRLAYEAKARSFLACRRREFYEENEKPTARFFGAVRAARRRGVFQRVKNEHGSIVTDGGQIVEVVTRHYRDFFKGEMVGEGGDGFLNLVKDRVPSDHMAGLAAPLTVAELHRALTGMRKGRAPGLDGLPVEFYLVFWDMLGPLLLEVFSEGLEAGQWGATFRVGVVTLIFKTGAEEDLGNWRPLTMLGVDYKIIAKVLANRLGAVLPVAVHVDQTCGVAGRSTRQNLQLVRDITAWAEDRNMPLMVVGLDQAKAFDRVHWGYLFSVLDTMGFDSVFVGWLKSLYTGARSVVMVNGTLGEDFVLNAGVRQGCPLSPLLFVLYMEPLAAAIRADPGVRGALVPGGGSVRVKLSQYADDTTLFLDRDECAVRAVAVFEEFGKVSGARLNIHKCVVKFFGRWKGRDAAPGGLPVCQGPLKVLGVLFDASDCAALNWGKAMGRVRTKLGLWKTRKLTLSGKVMVLKAEVLSSVLHLAYVFPLPMATRRLLRRAVFDFLWGGGYEWVARDRMVLGVKDGGRDVPDFPLKLDIFFVTSLLHRMMSREWHPGVLCMRYFFSYAARGLIPWTNVGPRSEQLPWHYAVAAAWLRSHPETLKDDNWRRHKVLYALVRGKATARPVVGVPPTVWGMVQTPGISNGLKDLHWACLHNSLPVREKMHRHGLHLSSRCPRKLCTADETVHHVMWGCWFARGVWARAQRVLRLMSPGFTLTWEVVERGSGVVGIGQGWKIFWLILSLYKRELWLDRQELVRNGRVHGVEGVVRRVEWEVRDRVQWDVERWGFHAAREKWKGVFEWV